MMSLSLLIYKMGYCSTYVLDQAHKKLTVASGTQNSLINAKQCKETQSRRALDYFGLWTKERWG